MQRNAFICTVVLLTNSLFRHFETPKLYLCTTTTRSPHLIQASQAVSDPVSVASEDEEAETFIVYKDAQEENAGVDDLSEEESESAEPRTVLGTSFYQNKIHQRRINHPTSTMGKKKAARAATRSSKRKAEDSDDEDHHSEDEGTENQPTVNMAG